MCVSIIDRVILLLILMIFYGMMKDMHMVFVETLTN